MVSSGYQPPLAKVATHPSEDQTLKVWDLETGEVIATFTCDSGARCCTYYDALKLIVAGDNGGHVYFLSLEEPKRRA